MSSEVYARWNVRNLERVHNQLMAKLAAERESQAELLRQMLHDASSLKNDIMAARRATFSVGTNPAGLSSTKMNNTIDEQTDEIITEGLSESFSEQAQIVATSGKRNLMLVDWSSLLDSVTIDISEKEKKIKYAQEINAHLSRAILNSSEDIHLYNTFVSYLNDLLSDEDLDYDFFKSLIDTRFEQLKESVDFSQTGEIDDITIEYFALCQMLGRKTKRMAKDEMDKANSIMKKELLEKQKEEFVYENLREVFAELNMKIDDEMELDGLSGFRVVDDEIPDCSIFMSSDGRGFMFETIADVVDGETVSSDRKAHIEESAQRFCKKHLAVIQKMRERGIDLIIECEEAPKAERIRQVKRAKKDRTKSKNAGKTKAMGG